MAAKKKSPRGRKKKPRKTAVIPMPPREPAAEAKADIPNPPALLDREAMAEWRRVTKHLASSAPEHLESMDRAVLSIYCQTWSDYCAAVKEERENGSTFLTDNGYETVRPCVNQKKEATAKLLRYAAELGITPGARKRTVAAAQRTGQAAAKDEKPVDKLGDFLGERKKA